MQQRLITAFAIVAVLAASGCAAQAPTADVGECLQMESLEGEVSDLPTVDCAEEHDGQVVHAFDMPGQDYPSDKEWASAIEGGCLKGFEKFVGTEYAESTLSVRDLSPTEESWKEDDRQVLCIAFTEAEPVTESFEGAEL